MAFWNSEKLNTQIAAQDIVTPFRRERVKNCAYELSVGRQHYSTEMKGGVEVVADGKQIIIPSGQLALLVTEEVVDIPVDAIGFISMKFSAKLRGLINVSGFHVDPGFRGHLKFAVYNAGSSPAVFTPGSALFQLWLADLCSTSEKYNGVHSEGQNQINHKDVMELQGDVASPAQLHSEIGNLRNELRILEFIGTGLLLALIGVWLQNLFGDNSKLVPSVQQVFTTDRLEPVQGKDGAKAKGAEAEIALPQSKPDPSNPSTDDRTQKEGGGKSSP